MQYCQTSVAGLLLLGNMDGEFTRKRENIALRLSAEIGFYLILLYLPAISRMNYYCIPVRRWKNVKVM